MEAILTAKNSAMKDIAQKRYTACTSVHHCIHYDNNVVSSDLEREKSNLQSELDRLKDEWSKERSTLEETRNLLMSQKTRLEMDLSKVIY